MAKYLQSKDGSRFLVSNDTPEDVEELPSAITKPLVVTVTAPISSSPAPMPVCIILILESLSNSDEAKRIAVQVTSFEISDRLIQLSGSILFSEFGWLVGHYKVNLLQQLLVEQTESSEQTISLLPKGQVYRLESIRGKDMNAAVVHINLSFRRTILKGVQEII